MEFEYNGDIYQSEVATTRIDLISKVMVASCNGCIFFLREPHEGCAQSQKLSYCVDNSIIWVKK